MSLNKKNEKILKKESCSLVVVPVYNEYPAIKMTMQAVISCKRCNNSDLLVIDDGSTDGSGEYLQKLQGISLIRNDENSGAGGVLLRGFEFAKARKYRYVVTIDSDGQHNACQIREFLYKIRQTGADIVSGTRYPAGYTKLSKPFQDRQEVNKEITSYINEVTGLSLTDVFCGFKAYKVSSLRKLKINETGYGMLLELTVKAAKSGLNIVEHPVPLIYLDETRDFNNNFKDTAKRKKYYYSVIEKAIEGI